MLPRVLPFALVAVFTLPIASSHAGGWAVITVEDLPQQLIVAAPTALTFSVRQHGIRLLNGLPARVSAVSDGRLIEATVVPGEPGYYKASLTVPRAGAWRLTIQSGFGASAVTLMPIRAIAEGTPPPAVPLAQRGLDLFVAKGCNSCHYHGDTKAQPMARVGEDLTDKRYSDGLLAKMLEEPSIIPKTQQLWTMPNLGLKREEISALVAFINRR